jgi:hypothetical protein
VEKNPTANGRGQIRILCLSHFMLGGMKVNLSANARGQFSAGLTSSADANGILNLEQLPHILKSANSQQLLQLFRRARPRGF